MAGFNWFWKALSGKQGRNQKRSVGLVSRAAELEPQAQALSDADLADFARQHATDAPELLAALREVSQRTLSMRPFDVQLQGALALMEGDVIQMATGEGKTLSGALAAAGFALRGHRVHSVTVNDYLAGRDAQWMQPLFGFLGLSVAAISPQDGPGERRKAYAADIVYAAVNELGFDVLRDRCAPTIEDRVQSPAAVAIIDEADSVLVDEALVPLVLAGNEPGTAPTGQITDVVRRLQLGDDYTVDEGRRNVFLTDTGAARVERLLGISSLYDAEHVGTTLVQVNVALHAHELLQRDVDYIVRDGKVQLIDASRGRVAELQRWPDGLQAAVEAKEGLQVSEGGRILDSMTIQQLVGRYDITCGMTGTATSAGDQFREFYGLHVSVIEPNVPCIRDDEPDRIYATTDDAFAALIDEVVELNGTGRPILVGTRDVAESERLADALVLRGIESSVLNAKNDELEAQVIAGAGDIGRVTVSTQMAGRGTDIRLGGADESNRDAVVERGGLCVIGLGKHRTDRLDNQLRGRAGRQGDPGSSVFFVSLDDPVISEGAAGETLSVLPEDDGRVRDKRAYQFIDRAQRVTEATMLSIHATTWKYNKLIGDQREILDERREKLLTTNAAWEELSKLASARAKEVEAAVGREVAEDAAREIMLSHLDRGWSDHLADLDDLRESIHLRALAKESPIAEFHRAAIGAFKNLVNNAVTDSVQTFQEVEIDSDGAHLEDTGLARPSSTWTYMVNDNPLSNGGGSVVGSIAAMFR
ncbi:MULTISPECIES: accessory Sec system translocase SecA2 [Corynebacterium]|uniref:Protein translocase subunit SecA n=1 Tax=Corynebacterium amycolatum TaxID=43765 RepID=A0AB38XTP1_CORAY|nr:MULTISPECIES: accessory Sec system translocase SecA2 [Corynebacterium]AIN83302.1 accessory Sec system translocase SecA2 [Corynebacterium sp. ATCC 6931]MBC6727077.1 accessory Sec system translocase SecA2 [Corynebacterium amycolatum]MDY7342250.1 accessory Sec system translocase SecA2 [Corynebacterium amycolatum]OFU54799.1 accessory Sec system translocase SecA2 [Corynebacterium sp. HMSC11H10]QQU98337.1 accessory Sec system translocase SecA2 [Corynebacterium amycolatum]